MGKHALEAAERVRLFARRGSCYRIPAGAPFPSNFLLKFGKFLQSPHLTYLTSDLTSDLLTNSAGESQAKRFKALVQVREVQGHGGGKCDCEVVHVRTWIMEHHGATRMQPCIAMSKSYAKVRFSSFKITGSICFPSRYTMTSRSSHPLSVRFPWYRKIMWLLRKLFAQGRKEESKRSFQCNHLWQFGHYLQ